ncbi:hypothetical protein B0H16DRAFT_1470569 [Mycena metata]|uniref:Uncharacterized protein n=1 Tax=Mycena metata TaxID=1033252 RepID=A0AAD7HTR2_9AGAR|nr:hypothetical protein B0H16DRAFT_1470569 [Mycena metata]
MDGRLSVLVLLASPIIPSSAERLKTKARAAPLARLVVQAIADDPNFDPFQALLYNPLNRTNANNAQCLATDNWCRMSPGPNGFAFIPPDAALFNASKVVIVSNGRVCGRCFPDLVTMAKEEGVKTVFVGGKSDVKQEYCGTVGGQSTDYSTLDTDIKTTHLKTNSLAPPDLYVCPATSRYPAFLPRLPTAYFRG